MIWASWRMHRTIYLVSIAIAAVLAIWLYISGTLEASAWTSFTSHNCSPSYPGSSEACMAGLTGTGSFSTVNVWLCGSLPAILGLVLGVPLVAGEIEQRTNRLAWTQSITKNRWLFSKIGVGATIVVGIVGAMAPMIWWWTDAARRSTHIQPSNFDISGFVIVAYALFAFMLGVALGALIRRTGWAFAACIPVFVLVRFVVRLYVRPTLISPTTRSTSVNAPISSVNWQLHSGFVPIGHSAPTASETWSSNSQVIQNCQGLNSNTGKPALSTAYCEKLHHLHYVLQYHPPSHFWSLQLAESAIFLGAALFLLGITVLAVRRWRT